MSHEGEDLAGIPTSTSKEASTCKPVPEAAMLQHEEYWFNCKKGDYGQSGYTARSLAFEPSQCMSLGSFPASRKLVITCS